MMTKNPILAISSTTMFLILATLACMIPEPVGNVLAMFTLPLLFALLLGILVGGIFPLIVALAPLIAMLITKEGDFLKEVLPQMVLIGAAGFTAGLAFGKFRTAIGANLMGFFLGVVLYGFFRFFGTLFYGETYQLLDFIYERFIHCWPGVVLSLLVPPVVCAIIRRAGLMKVLRDGFD